MRGEVEKLPPTLFLLMARRNTTRTAIVWSAAETFSLQGMQLIVYIVLARLVSPAAFGLTAMLAVFFSLSQILADSGFSNALIQKKDADDLDKSTVFYFNLAVGAILAGSVCLASGWIADFYGEPILQPLTCVMSLMIVASSFGLIQLTLTRKELDFRTRTIAAGAAAVSSGTVSIAMAVYGLGVWALAAQMILMRLFQTVLLWIICSWRPQLAFSLERLRSMFSFGSKMLIAGLVSAFFNNIYALAIGKYYSATLVGYYASAKRYQEFPTKTINSVFSKVSFPSFSRHQDDIDRIRVLFEKKLRLASLLVFPTLGLLCGVATPLFDVVLGEQWLPAVPIFQLLCVVGLFHPLSTINLAYLLARGDSGKFLILEIVKRSLTVVNLIVALPLGIIWLVVGEIVVCMICFFVNSYYTARFLSISSVRQLAIVSKNVALAALVGLVGYLATSMFVVPLAQLAGGIVAGAFAGLSFLYCFDRHSIQEIRNALSNVLPGRPKVGHSG